MSHRIALLCAHFRTAGQFNVERSMSAFGLKRTFMSSPHFSLRESTTNQISAPAVNVRANGWASTKFATDILGIPV